MVLLGSGRTHSTIARISARREVLAGARLGVFGVALKQALVDVAFDVGAQRHPLRFIDHVDQAIELGRILNLVLRLGEDRTEHTRLVAQLAQERHVMHFEIGAPPGLEAGPVVLRGDADLAAVRRLAVLVGHLEEDQIGELFEVVAVTDAVVA